MGRSGSPEPLTLFFVGCAFDGFAEEESSVDYGGPLSAAIHNEAFIQLFVSGTDFNVDVMSTAGLTFYY